MRLLFVTHIPEDDSNGVWKKIVSQVDSLKDIGYEVTLISFHDKNTINIQRSQGVKKIKTLHRYLFHFYLSMDIKKSFDLIYVRKPHGGLYPVGLSWFLKKMHRNNNPTIYMEIPTYPFKNESKGIFGKISSLIFDLEISKAKKYIYQFLVIGDLCNKLYNIPAKNIINGVNVNKISLLEKDIHTKTGEIVFLGVANLAYWHGYDRLISSITNYNGNLDVKFIIIGDNEPELSRLKGMSLGSDKIIFLGKMNTSQINEVLKTIDIGVDSLGRHRSGNNNNSSIKSKEYTAMGLPFIMSHDDSGFSEGLPFIFKCSPTDEPLDINAIINWYHNLPPSISSFESNYAKENFSWQSIFNKNLKRKGAK